MSAVMPDQVPAWAQVSPERRAHIGRVAELAARWADRLAVAPDERRRWLWAVWLHDALRDADAATLARWAPDAPGPGELRHGPASAARAAADGERDQGVLDAVRFHSLGYAGWDMVGRVLYCADYLEPGRTFKREWRAELAARYPDAPDDVLRTVAADRLRQLVESRWPIPEPTAGFWNSVVASSGPR
jgi:HD superfamily phosphohydrolase YqeK